MIVMINKFDLSNKAVMLRKKFGEDAASPTDIFKLVQSIENLTLVIYPLNRNISGVSYKGKISSVIVINSDMSIGRQRFSLAHELYHLYYDFSEKSSVSSLKIGSGDEIERSADQFASYFLLPSEALYAYMDGIRSSGRNSLNIEDVIKLEQYFGLSHKAIIYRLLDEGLVDYEFAKSMDSGVIEIAARLGYDTSLYYPPHENQRVLVLGAYISKAEKLLEKDMISRAKYEELLLDAFKDDIVYGTLREGVDID